MSTISKIVIIIPIAVILLALYIKFFPSHQTTILPSSTKKNTEMLTPSIKAVRLDLTGPFTCDFRLDTATISAYVKNRQISAQIKESSSVNYLLVKGDCFYQWEDRVYQGEKTCGISSILSTVDSLMTMGAIDIKSLMDLIPSSISKEIPSSDEAKLTTALQSCVKKDMNSSVFDLPKNVSFEDKKL